MPFTNYAELKAAVKDWLHRSDLDARIPDFIALAETRMNRIAQVRSMEIEVPLTLTIGARLIMLPAAFSAPLAVWLVDTLNRYQLSPGVPEQLTGGATQGRPAYWAIDGANLAFDTPADQAYQMTLRYRGGLALSDASPTNTVLTKYPDLYLYGALLESAPWLRDLDSMNLWQAMYGRAVKEVNLNESRARSVAPLRSEIGQFLACQNHDIYWGG